MEGERRGVKDSTRVVLIILWRTPIQIWSPDDVFLKRNAHEETEMEGRRHGFKESPV